MKEFQFKKVENFDCRRCLWSYGGTNLPTRIARIWITIKNEPFSEYVMTQLSELKETYYETDYLVDIQVQNGEINVAEIGYVHDGNLKWTMLTPPGELLEHFISYLKTNNLI